jgi:hypothetical protein
MSEVTWNTTGTILAYPKMPEYPSCDEILALAGHLQAYFSEIQTVGSSESEYDSMEEWGKEEPVVAPEPEPEPFPTPVAPAEQSSRLANPHRIHVVTEESTDAPVQQPTQPS